MNWFFSRNSVEFNQIKKIISYLDKLNWSYALQAKESIIYTTVQAKNIEQLDMTIYLDTEVNYLTIAVQNLLQIKNSVYKGVLFQTLLDISYNSRLIRWGYNSINGEVCASVELPLESTLLTEKQFYYCLQVLIYIIDEVAIPRLQSVLETGIDPGVEEVGKQLLENLENNLPDSALESLYDALKERRQKRNG